MDVGAFAGMAQSLEPVLRGPGFDAVWARISANVFGLDEVTPEVRAFVLATSKPNQEVVLGYWQELFDRSPQELDAMVSQGAAAIRGSGVPYVSVMGHDPSPDERRVAPGEPPGRPKSGLAEQRPLPAPRPPASLCRAAG